MSVCNICGRVCFRTKTWKKEQRGSKNALALAMSCGRLGAFTPPLLEFNGLHPWGTSRFFREVSIYGPCHSGGHLADYLRQRLFLCCQNLVVAHRGVCCGCRD